MNILFPSTRRTVSRAWSAAAALTAVVVTSTAHGGEPPSGTNTVEGLLPSATILVGFVNDADAYSRANAMLPLSKIMAEQEVVTFLDKPKKAIDAVLAKVEAQIKEQEGFADFSLNTQELLSGTYGRMFVALTHVTLPLDPGSDPDVGFVFGIERKQGAPDWSKHVKDIVARLSAQTPAGNETRFESVEVEGSELSYEVLRGADESNRAPIILAEWQGLQLFSLSTSSMVGVLSRAKGVVADSLATNPRYVANQKEIGGCGAGSACMFVNIEQLVELAAQGVKLGLSMQGGDPSQAQLVDRVIDASGIKAAKSLIMKSEARDGAAFSTSFMEIEGEQRGLMAAMRANPVDLARLRSIPDNASSFSLGSFDMAPLYDFVMSSLKEFHPETHEMVISQLDALGKQVGGEESPINLRNDLFQNLGPGYYSLTPKRASMMTQIPPMLFAIEVRNPDRVVDSIRKLIEFAGEQFGSPMRVESKEAKGGGYTLHEINLEGQLAIVRPAFTVADGHLLVSTEPGLVKQHMKRLEKGDVVDITSAPDYQRFASHIPEKGVTWLSYGDTRYTFESIYDTFISTVPMFAQMSEVEIPIDFQVAPMRETISQHLFGDLSYTVETERGVRSQSYGSIGADAASLVMGALAGGGLVAFAHQMDQNAGGSMMSGATASGTSPVKAESNEEQARNDLKLLSSNIVLYRLEKDALPSVLEDLVAQLPNYPNGLLDGNPLPLDPWGQAYRYQVDGKDYKIWTTGPDKVDNDGAGDDIVRSNSKN